MVPNLGMVTHGPTHCFIYIDVSVLEVMTSMDFQTLPYLYVTISFLLEICFLGPTHPTFSDDVTNYTLFFLKSSLT